MTTVIYLVGVGARTPLGLQAAPAASALRAGVSAVDEHPFLVDSVGDLMPGALDTELDARLMGPARLVALADNALREACAPLAAAPTPCQLSLYLGLPDLRPGFAEQDAAEVRMGLTRLEGLPAEIKQVSVFSQGHAAGCMALAAAVKELREGGSDACLVGGVESYFHPDTMEWLDANRQLLNSRSRGGFIPGEGAGFCLVVNDKARARFGLRPLMTVRAVTLGQETKLIHTTDTCLGEGLTSTVRDAVAGLQADERINEIIGDINGERYRGEEWGFVCLRLSHYFDDPTAYQSPADCWGDMGAASLPLFAVLACQAAARGYAKGPRTLLWTSSEKGLRGVVVLEGAYGD